MKRDLAGHDVFTLREAGLKGLKNGTLLRSASGRYDVFVTVDQNLEYQQNLKQIQLAVIILCAKSSAYSSLEPLVPPLLEAITAIKPGDVLRLGR